MKIRNKLLVFIQSILILGLSINAYAGEIDTKGLPEEVSTYIQQRELCNQAREILINHSNAKKQILENARVQAKIYCMGKDRQSKKLMHAYKNNPKAMEKLTLVNGMGDIVAIDAPIQFGQTIDVLMPKDVVAALPQLSACLHFAGEFGGDNSQEDKDVIKAMDKLKCNQVDQTLNHLQKAYESNADAQMFIYILKNLF